MEWVNCISLRNVQNNSKSIQNGKSTQSDRARSWCDDEHRLFNFLPNETSSSAMTQPPPLYTKRFSLGWQVHLLSCKRIQRRAIFSILSVWSIMSPHLQYMYSYIEGDFTLDDDPVHQKNLTGRPFSLAIVQFTKKTYQSTAILILLDGRNFYNSKSKLASVQWTLFMLVVNI